MSQLAKFSSDINRYVISVNGELTGYAPTLETAKFISEKMAEEMVNEFKSTKPHYSSEIIPQGSGFKVKCISRGWFYNGVREFTIKFSPIPELIYKPVTNETNAVSTSSIEITETKTEAIVEMKTVPVQPSNLASKGGIATQVSASADSPNSPIQVPSFYSQIPFPPNLPPPPKNYRRVPRRENYKKNGKE